jgi:manganese oxidase
MVQQPHFRIVVVLLLVAGALVAEPRQDRDLPVAVPNDQRTPAGQMVDGELHVELEAVRAAWYPRGPDGPLVETPAFREVGGPPQVPAPLIRASAGTPVRVSVRNTLDRQVTVRGLLDRGSLDPAQVERAAGAPPIAPDFLFADSLVVPAGEVREVRFTSSAEVTSIYFGRTEARDAEASVPPWQPGGETDGVLEGGFIGAFVVDPPGAAPDPGERLFLITTGAVRQDPVPILLLAFNGLSWPFTERLEYDLHETVRWRVLNASISRHPLHLHGFYFTVDGVGNGDSDRPLDPEERRLVVTEQIDPVSSFRMSWTAAEPGNWLFHCHMIRHMGPLQRFSVEGPPPAPDHDHEMHHMAGLLLGVMVRPPPGWDDGDPSPARRIDLWTGARPGVFGDDPELGFVVQEGAEPPPPDSTRVPGSPLVLHRGEPTEIVVHNRLETALSVHWHGLELRSRYDGVGHWSGLPGAMQPPILPGESGSVLIQPPRAGTFIYHIHGEVGHELSQGLYGPFLVHEAGETWDRERDRVYVLATRGTEVDSPPALNGQVDPPAERFRPGEEYRLRFLQISPDETNDLRLLWNGEPTQWRPLARDGADLPEGRRTPVPARLHLDVGQTFDVAWVPREAGVRVLEIVTRPATPNAPPVTRRVPFVVGDVPEEEIREAVRVP